MKIVHFEDEWPRARTIPHWLHDKIFQMLPPQEAVELDLREVENPNGDVPSQIVVGPRGKPDKAIFEYCLITEFEVLKKHIPSAGIVIVDIMRSDENGRFVSNLEQINSVFRDWEKEKDNWRYFSAYPEKVPEDAELKGFAKRQEADLVEYLYAKLREVSAVP